MNQFVLNDEETRDSLFLSDAFRDTLDLRNYLSQKSTENSKGEYSHFDFVIRETEDYLAVCYRAEEYCKKNPFTVYSRHKELVASVDDFKEEWTKYRGDEPPDRIITRIARSEYVYIDHILRNMRKVLQRTRESMPISRVQEMDGQCLRNFIRLPGRTIEEKAGNRQTILAVRRVESYNTLENRVLKDFLSRCIAEGNRYIQWHNKPEYKNTVRLKSVMRLVARYEKELTNPVFVNIQQIRDLPDPNFVLMQDQFYSRLWVLYLELVGQAKMIEKVWKNRHHLFEDSVGIWVRIILALNYPSLKKIYRTTPILSGKCVNGRFVEEFLPFEVYSNKKSILAVKFEKGKIIFSKSGLQKEDIKTKTLKIAYLPLSLDRKIKLRNTDDFILIRQEGNNIKFTNANRSAFIVKVYEELADKISLVIDKVMEELCI